MIIHFKTKRKMKKLFYCAAFVAAMGLFTTANAQNTKKKKEVKKEQCDKKCDKKDGKACSKADANKSCCKKDAAKKSCCSKEKAEKK